jgi:uncharacterized Fe-S cluster-containing MiaB family protein
MFIDDEEVKKNMRKGLLRKFKEICGNVSERVMECVYEAINDYINEKFY